MEGAPTYRIPGTLVPVVPGMRYRASAGDVQGGPVCLVFYDQDGKQLEPSYPLPTEAEAPEEARSAQFVTVTDTSIYLPLIALAEPGALPVVGKTTVMPDRLSVDPKSAFHDPDLIRRGVGVRFKGVERANVEEYCLSEGWVRLQTATRNRSGQKMSVKLQGTVEVWMRDEA